jgi:hypothetical protein
MTAMGSSAVIALAWGEERVRELARLREVLEKAGVTSEIAFGLSDEGDPWCAFCRPGSNHVLAHFAFIDEEYIGDWPGLRRIVRSNELGDVIARFLHMNTQAFLASTSAQNPAENSKFQ